MSYLLHRFETCATKKVTNKNVTKPININNSETDKKIPQFLRNSDGSHIRDEVIINM